MQAALDEIEDALPRREITDHRVHMVVDKTGYERRTGRIDRRLAIDRRRRRCRITDVRDRPLPDYDGRRPTWPSCMCHRRTSAGRSARMTLEKSLRAHEPPSRL